MAKNKRKKGQKQGFKRPKYKKAKNKGQNQAQQQAKPTPSAPASTTSSHSITVNTLAEPAQPTLGIKEGKATLVFNATDTLFFRESRPMEAMGELQSVFPPSMQTLAGAIRTFIGDSEGVNWHNFDKDHPLSNIIGYGDDLGALRFQGAWLALDGERLYPAPLLIMKKEDALYRLTLSEQGIYCDLGKNVRLPQLPDEAKGSKPLEKTWLTATGFTAVLQGKTPPIDSIKTAEDIFETESRVGIARNNATRAVEKSMLYQTEHIRPKQALTIEVDTSGLPDSLPTSTMLRLGGEGRSANLTLQQKLEATLQSIKANNNTQGIILYLLTPLKQQQHPLAGFEKQENTEQTVWTGTLNGIELELHSAVTGKAIRDGGWDLARRQPRTANSLIPAGSAFFCKVKNGDNNTAIEKLHNTHIGDQTEYGLGHIVAGLWLD